jgi:two-component SAPR family response regulator
LGYWIFYGDLRVNEKGGIAFYKNNRYTFRSTKSKNFQLLCYLVKNHGKEIPVTEVYNIIWPESDKYKEKTKKQAIKDSIQTIKSNLKISLDQRPTISFTFKGNSIMLISNSP